MSQFTLLKTSAFGVVAVGIVLARLAQAGEGPTSPSTLPKRTAIEFLDTRTVEHTYFLDRRVTPVNKHEKNPVLTGCHSAQTVVRDKDGELRMWYVTRRKIPGYTGSAREYTLRYAESTDGVTWSLPNLGLKQFDGSRDNNVIFTANDTDVTGRKMFDKHGLVHGNFCVIDRKQEPAPRTRGRFTALFCTWHGGLCMAYSDDGLRWTAYRENPVFALGGSDTFNNFLFDTQIGRYVLYHRPHPKIHAGSWAQANRLVARIESDDLLHWDSKTARNVLDTDGRDAPRSVSTCLRQLRNGISVFWTRFARRFPWTWGPAPTPPGFFQA